MTHYGDYRDILVSKGIPVRQDIERTRKQPGDKVLVSSCLPALVVEERAR